MRVVTFQVISQRQERLPIIITTNLPFSEWTSIFPDQRLYKALIDRITHHAHIIDTGRHFKKQLKRNALTRPRWGQNKIIIWG